MEQVFNPRRLDKALTYRCKSVSELAEKTNIARQYISGYRNGKLVPKVEQVKIIADVLEMPRRFFYEKDYTESISPVYFRSQLTTRKAYREYQKIKIEFTEQLYKFLSDYIEFPALNLPDFGVVTPKEAAKRLREHWGLGNEPIENIITVVENNGIIVSCCGTNTDAIDAFSKKVILEDGTKTFFKEGVDDPHQYELPKGLVQQLTKHRASPPHGLWKWHGRADPVGPRRPVLKVG